jgi:A/G-specific adenine glycosylase
MLQQTRVAAVTDHYQKFLRRFPTVEKLASARESSVLAAWSGLGYYRRARMLHTAAKKIVKEYRGEFPGSAEDLCALPGIGRYTAAAIASIAFDQPVAVVDGNVERVLQRIHGKKLAGEELWRAAGELLNRRRPGDFNQAMMELGATICLPRKPQCLLCPVSDLCATRGELPRPQNQIRQTKREVHYALASLDGAVFLVKRPKASTLMPGMWELPETTSANGASALLTLRHSITVTDYLVRVMKALPPQGAEGRWVRKSHVPTLPLTGLTRKILRAAKII